MENYISDEENIIAKNLIQYIRKREFVNRSIASLDRIIYKYFSDNNRDPTEEKEVIDFLFRYLDEKGENGSILFRHIQNSAERYNIIINLHNKYQGKFEFNLVNPSLFLTSFDLIKTNQKLKKILYFFALFIPFLTVLSISLYFQAKQMRAEFDQQLTSKEIQLQQKNQYIERLENETTVIKQKYASILEEKKQYKDSFDLGKVDTNIYQNANLEPDQIKIFAYGKNRIFKVDENRNVIIRNRAVLKKISQVHRRKRYGPEVTNEYPVRVISDFAHGKIHPRVEGQALTTVLSHQRLIIKRTVRTRWELTIELFDGFVFKDSMSPFYTLKSPNIDFCGLRTPTHNERKSVDVPTELQITLI